MVKKSITVDSDAYERLDRARFENESFSQTIRRLIPNRHPDPKPFDLEAWLRQLAAIELSDEFYDAVEQQIAERNRR